MPGEHADVAKELEAATPIAVGRATVAGHYHLPPTPPPPALLPCPPASSCRLSLAPSLPHHRNRRRSPAPLSCPRRSPVPLPRRRRSPARAAVPLPCHVAAAPLLAPTSRSLATPPLLPCHAAAAPLPCHRRFDAWRVLTGCRWRGVG